MRAGTLAILLVHVRSYQILKQDGWFKQQYFMRCYDLCDVMKADIPLGNSGASNCWTRQMKDAFGDLQNGTVYWSDLFQCRKLNISNLRIDLRFRHQAVWREAHDQDPCSCLKSLWLITTGLLCLRDRFLMHVHHLSCRSIWRWLWAKVLWGT